MRQPKGVIKKTVNKGIEAKSQAAIVFTGPFQFDPSHRLVIRALANIVQARLRDLVREDLGGTYSIGASAGYAKVPVETYTFNISWGCNPDRVEELIKAVFRDIEDIRTNGPTDKQVTDTITQLQREFETSIKQNYYVASQLYFKYLYGEDVKTFFELPEAYKTLTPAIIRDAARTYLNPENYVQVTLFPEKKTTPSLIEQVSRWLLPPAPVLRPAPAF